MDTLSLSYASNPDCWVAAQPNQTAVLVDPATGQVPLDGHYAWLDSEPKWVEGREHLTQLGSKLRIRHYMGKHTSAEELPSDLEDRVADCAFMAIEDAGHDPETFQLEVRRLKQMSEDDRRAYVASRKPDYAWTTQQQAVAVKVGVPIFSFDFTVFDTLPDTILRRGFAHSRAQIHDPRFARQFNALQAFREALWTGRLGYSLLGMAGVVGEEACGYIATGGMHRGFTNKLGKLGTNVTPDIAPLPPDHIDVVQACWRVTETGLMTPEDVIASTQ